MWGHPASACSCDRSSRPHLLLQSADRRDVLGAAVRARSTLETSGEIKILMILMMMIIIMSIMFCGVTIKCQTGFRERPWILFLCSEAPVFSRASFVELHRRDRRVMQSLSQLHEVQRRHRDLVFFSLGWWNCPVFQHPSPVRSQVSLFHVTLVERLFRPYAHVCASNGVAIQTTKTPSPRSDV